MPQLIQRNQQLTARVGSSDSNREVFNSPINIAKVEERLQNTKLLDFSTEDQYLQVGVLDEERGELLVDENQGFTERIVSVDYNSDLLDQNFNLGLLSCCCILSTLLQSSNQWARSSGNVDCDDLFNSNFGEISLDIEG